MKILFDQGTPTPLRHQLPGHVIDTVFELGWSTYANGDLLIAAEHASYHLFVTTDQNLSYQQNLVGRKLAILVLGTTSWPMIRLRVDEISAVVDSMLPGDFRVVAF